MVAGDRLDCASLLTWENGECHACVEGKWAAVADAVAALWKVKGSFYGEPRAIMCIL